MEDIEKIDPADVNKTPKIIKIAKEDIGKLDVLVCGECHEVFYFIEDLKEHKENNKCEHVSVIRDRCRNESRPQMWAFMLWKHAQTRKELEDENVSTPWSIYQQWCQLSLSEKEGWIIAAENIQCFSKISLAKVQEVKANAHAVKSKLEKSNVQLTKSNSGDELNEEGEILHHDSENDAEDESEDKVKNNNVNRKPVYKPKPGTNLLKDIKSIPPTLRKALRTGKNENIEEAIVEKILGRRVNQKKKCTEYCIKWENLPESENTWEPKIHLIKCKALMCEFDSIIDKKKNLVKSNSKSLESQLEEMESDHSRPQRTSKQKALSQVKVWCGDISEGDESSVKRKSFSDDDDDSTDSFEKKIKMEDDSDTTDDDKPAITIRRVPKSQSSINGVAKKNSDGTVSSVQRVVRVNQKQLPNLSSGVYIMSKTEGIIKLDSNTSAAGDPLLKVGSKIGQTHIKMVKKDENISPKSIAARLQSVEKKPLLTPKGRISTQKRLLSSSPATKTVVKSESSDKLPISKKNHFDDESDGLEELEFPTDLPLPEPDSPPGEFTLCPLTGRVLGETEESKEPEETSVDSTSLDTLVKLAAAELPDVDLDSSMEKKESSENTEITSIVQTGTQQTPTTGAAEEPKLVKPIPPPLRPPPLVTSVITTNSIATTVTDLEASIKPTAIEKSTSIILNLDDVLTSSQPKITEPSLTNTTLTNVHVLSHSNRTVTPKKLLSTPSTVRQKVTTFQQRQTINKPITPKPNPTTTIIHKVSPNRNKLNASKRFHEPLLPMVKKTANISTYKPSNITKRIGNTTIYKTTEKAPSVSTVKKGPPLFSVPQVVSTPSPSSKLVPLSSTVINMPLLTADEESAPVTESTNTTQHLAEIQPLTLTTDSEIADLTTFNLADSDTPLLITGDDGTIYQVAGQNEDGQTILISEGPDGQQQCVIVSSECTSDEITMIGDTSTEPEQMEIDQALTINAQVDPESDNADSEESQVVAQIIKADPPSPGGTRKVVLMLPDGNLMMTNVTAEQYAALELDK